MEHCWIQSSSADDLPCFAIKGGYDCDGTPIYVGRAKHQGEILPAKVIPSKGCAYVSWGGQEHSKNYYEVLVGPGYSWCMCEKGTIPSMAVSSGTTPNGEPLYVGRSHHANSLTVGKVHPSHGCLYIPFAGQEISLSSYEALICEASDKWVSSSLENIPRDAVLAGYDSDYTAILVGRSWHEGHLLPAKVVPSRCEVYISFDGSEIQKSHADILCGCNYNWITADVQNIPDNAVFTGRFDDGEPLFVGRARHCGSLTPGLVSPTDQCLLIPYGGREIHKHEFEILVRN